MAKQALCKHWNLKTKLVSFIGEEENVKREGEEKRKKESQAKKVWKLTLLMNPMRFCINFHALMVILLPKSRVFSRVSS